MFRYGNVSRHISQFANGSNVLHLRPQVVENVKILLPEQELIDKFVSIIKPIFSQINTLQLQSANLTRQRDLLLPRLMSGQLTPLTNQ
jgi:type I restriction enzyme S subunit